MVEKLEEDTEPHVQQLFFESYWETDMRPQGLAGVGFCVVSQDFVLAIVS